jgi:hypothetical protein
VLRHAKELEQKLPRGKRSAALSQVYQGKREKPLIRG